MAIKQLKTCWRVDVTIPGQKRIRETFRTEEEAQAREKEILEAGKKGNQVTRHGDLHAGEPTLRALFEQTCRLDWTDPKHRSRTNCEKLIDEVLPVHNLGWDSPCTCITTLLMDEITVRLKEEGIKPKKAGTGGVPLADSTINRYKSAISHIIKIGRQYNMTSHAPYIRKGKESKGRTRLLSYEEEELLMEVSARYHEMYPDWLQFLLLTGMRLEESRWCHIDNVRNGEIELPGKVTKNGEPRTIPLDQVGALEYLEKWKHFKHIGHTMLYKWWAKIRDDMGLGEDGEFVYHMMRHTCATRMLDNGIPLQIIQKWLGHLDLKTTQRYAKISKKHLNDAAAIMKQKREERLQNSNLRLVVNN